MRLARWSRLWLPVAWLIACGGRFEKTTPDEEEGGTTSLGGSVAVGGTASSKGGKAGSASRAGRSGGGTVGTGGSVQTAGTFGVAGTTSCACPVPICGPAGHLEPNADGCCYHCVVNQMLCIEQRQEYLRLRAELIEKYSSVGCMIAEDCTVYYDKNSCDAGCGIPIPREQLDNLRSNLDSFALQRCDPACPPVPVPPCDAQAPGCVNGRCQ